MQLVFHLIGRLGNMFFIISAFYYALKHNIKSYIYIPGYYQYYLNTNTFTNVFINKIRDYIITDEYFKKDEYIHLYDIEDTDNKMLLDLDNIIQEYYNSKEKISFDIGLFQDCKYFLQYKDKIKNLFITETDNVLYYKNIINENDVFISVRRGDYIESNFYVLNENYYIDVYNMYFKGKNIYISSDDIDWCKQKLTIDKFNKCNKIIYLEDLNAIEVISISQYFHNYICANSTFSMMTELFSNYNDKKVIGVHKISKIMMRDNAFDNNTILYDIENEKYNKYIDNINESQV